jgi:AraC-like DNA-binding protein
MATYIEFPYLPFKIAFRADLDNGNGVAPPHRHREIEIVQGKQGRTHVGLGGQIYVLGPGDILLIASGMPHFYLRSPGSVRSFFMFDSLIFDTKRLDISNADLNRDIAALVPFSMMWDDKTTQIVNDQLADLFQATHSGVNNIGILGRLYLLLNNLLTLLPKQPLTDDLLANYAEIRSKDVVEKLNQIYDYIAVNYAEPITLTDAATVVGFNPQYFSRFFKTNTGTNFSAFLCQYRLTQASYLLIEDNYSMTEVAERCGFSNVKTFHHSFKLHMGTSPLNYRKRELHNTNSSE